MCDFAAVAIRTETDGLHSDDYVTTHSTNKML